MIVETWETLSLGALQTRRLGHRLGELAQPGDVYLLVGNLGAGKTCLAQGIATGLGVRQGVLSPSFVLIREHQGRLPFYHVDLYRLEKTAEISTLGLEDYFSGDGVCVVEWADHALPLMPRERLLVYMRLLSARKRALRFEATGKRYYHLLDQLAALSPAALAIRGQG